MIAALAIAATLSAPLGHRTATPGPQRPPVTRHTDTIDFGLVAWCENGHPNVRIWNGSDHDMVNLAIWTLTVPETGGQMTGVVQWPSGIGGVWSTSTRSIFVEIRYEQFEARPFSQGIGIACPAVGGPGTF